METSISKEINVSEPNYFILNDNSSNVLYDNVSVEKSENTYNDNGSREFGNYNFQHFFKGGTLIPT